MKTALSSDMRWGGFDSSVRTNCGRKAKKKIASLGLRMLISMAETITWVAELVRVSASIYKEPCSFNVIQAM